MQILYDINDSMSIKALGQIRPWKRDEEKVFAKIDNNIIFKKIR